MKIDALGIVFSNMHDQMMQELTANRTMASVPYGGRYRLIDFVLSNMYNSGITKVGVITKNNYQSLIDHLGSGKEWDLSHKREGLYILPPFGRAQSGVYKSRIEALSGIRDFIRKSSNENVVMCDCDEICNMDYNEPLDFHNRNQADITCVYRRGRLERDGLRGNFTYRINRSGRAMEAMIDPQTDSEVNIGLHVWIVRRQFLERIVDDAVSRGIDSWERGVLMNGVRDYRIFCWKFTGYVGHVNSMSHYFNVNMDLLKTEVREQLFYQYGHIYTKVRDEAPARYGETAAVRNSLVADGCVIEGSVENSIIFRGVHVGKGAHVFNSIVMQGSRVDDNAQLNYVIIDKDVYITNNRTLMGYGTYPLFISKGSVV